jgi:hypothetical protein
MQLFVPDRRGGGSDPSGEQLQEAAQARIVEARRGFDHARGGFALTWFEHLGQGVGEVGRETAHELECRSRA